MPLWLPIKRDGAHGKDTTTREREISLLQVLRLAESEHRLRHLGMPLQRRLFQLKDGGVMKRDAAHGKDTTTREREISLLQGLRLAESEHRLRHAAMASAVSKAKQFAPLLRNYLFKPVLFIDLFFQGF